MSRLGRGNPVHLPSSVGDPVYQVSELLPRERPVVVDVAVPEHALGLVPPDHFDELNHLHLAVVVVVEELEEFLHGRVHVQARRRYRGAKPLGVVDLVVQVQVDRVERLAQLCLGELGSALVQPGLQFGYGQRAIGLCVELDELFLQVLDNLYVGLVCRHHEHRLLETAHVPVRHQPGEHLGLGGLRDKAPARVRVHVEPLLLQRRRRVDAERHAARQQPGLALQQLHRGDLDVRLVQGPQPEAPAADLPEQLAGRQLGGVLGKRVLLRQDDVHHDSQGPDVALHPVHLDLHLIVDHLWSNEILGAQRFIHVQV
mmetsp:Transcript_87427/g.231373  ORF Transcript_87427/g.231373 Transcript_87427/m.231373 type:complete len:314 (-) Transcript_87427:548-1489(-)